MSSTWEWVHDRASTYIPGKVADTISFLRDVADEYDAATKKHGNFTNAHEGWAVLYEEVDELWDEVRRKRSNRDVAGMRRECVQIAAMAMKFAICICKKERA